MTEAQLGLAGAASGNPDPGPFYLPPPTPRRCSQGQTMPRLFSPRPPPSEDLFYETYYSLSQQYPLLLLLLVIVLSTLLALLAVAWASGRVSKASDAGCLRAGVGGSPPRGHFQCWVL